MNPARTLFFLFCLGLLSSSCTEGDHKNKEEPLNSRDDSTEYPFLRIIDAYGETLQLDTPPERIISMAPNITEIIYFLQAENRLIARTDYCDYPPAAQNLPSIGTLGSYNYEQIIALKPDLILMMTFDGTSKEEYDRLKSLGLHPFAISEGNIDQVLDGIDTVSRVLGIDIKRTKTDSLRRIVRSIQNRAASLSPVSTFVVIDKSPLMTTSGGFIGSVIETAGGKNIAAGDPVPYPTYSREVLMRQDPEVILIPSTSDSAIDELLKLYPEWSTLRAVRNNRVRTIHHNLNSRPGPRIVEGLERVFELLH